MKEILIDKQIGSDWWEEGITSEFVRNELNAAGEDDIRITIDSPGGSVWDCIGIYNIIRDFCRNHKNKITTYIQGMAASSASVIALAASSINSENKIIVEDNSVYMIHKVWQVVIGNEEDMSEASEAMKKLDNLFAAAYSKKTGRSNKELLKEMGAETWLYGEEIVKEGFADEVVSANESKDESEENILTLAKAKVTSTQGQMKAMSAKEFMGKIAACVVTRESAGGANGKPDKNNMEGCKMTAEELKKNNPDVYAAIVAEGEAKGANAERERAGRLLAMGKKCGCTDYALECIENNANPTDSNVIDAFMDKKVAAQVVAAQKEDEKDIPEIVPPKDNSQRDNEAIMAAFDKELGRNS